MHAKMHLVGEHCLSDPILEKLKSCKLHRTLHYIRPEYSTDIWVAIWLYTI